MSQARHGWLPVGGLLAAWKGGLALTLVFTVAEWGEFDRSFLFGEVARWPRDSPPVFTTHFATWDAAHYLYLSEVGYTAGVRSVAFYPLFPLLVRWTAPLAGGNHLAIGLLLSNLFSLVAWVIFYERVRRRWGVTIAGWALAFLILFPGALFFQFLYSESLFFLLVMVLWWGLEERRRALVWGAALLLPLARAVGVFAVLPIMWRAAQEAPPRWFQRFGAWAARLRALSVGNGSRETGVHGFGPRIGSSAGRRARTDAGGDSTRAGRNERSVGVRISEAGLSTSPWTWLVAPLLGWGCYLALMAHWTGDSFLGFKAQDQYWRVHSVWNLVDVPKFVVGFFSPTQWHEFTGSLLDRCVFVLLLYALPMIWRLDKGLLVWTYWLGILPAMSGTFTSYTRFASCAFPMFIALGAFLSPKAGDATPRLRALLRWGLLAVFAVLHVVLVWRFLNFRWAG